MDEFFDHYLPRVHFYRLILLAFCAILVISGCAPTQTTVSVPATLSQNIMETPLPTSSGIPTSPVAPIPSDTPAPTDTSVPSVVCFATYYDPFAFLPEGKQLLVRAVMGVQIFDLQAMQEVRFIKAPGNLNGPFVALSPNGERLAWALEDGTIQILRIADQSVLANFPSGQTPPVKLEFSPASDKLYSVSHDGSVKSWDLDGNLLHALLPGFEMVNIGLSPDGSLLATVPSDGPVRLWSTTDFKWVKDLSGTGGYDTSDVAFSPDGQYLAADLVTSLFVWSIPDATELRGTITPTNSTAVAYSPDGRYLAYGELNNVVLSSPDGLQTIRTMTGHQGTVYALVFSPDSSLLVSTDGGEVRVWRVDDGLLLAIGKSSCP